MINRATILALLADERRGCDQKHLDDILAAYSEDKERLDWLERNCVLIGQEPEGSEYPGSWSIGPSGNFQMWAQRMKTARGAIDLAMTQHPKS